MLPGQVSANLCFEALQGGRKAALLIGAGCSYTAGIPTAIEFVDKVWKRHEKRCREKLSAKDARDYPAVISTLSPGEYLDLFRSFVDEAKVNLAHLCIGELVREKVVDRVLTTNFDPLVIRACAMAGEFPSIYDCVAVADLSGVFGDETAAVYYLHGQAYGLPMMNARKAIEDHSARVRNIVHSNIERRPLIVVGYSGTTDSVLEQLQTAHTKFPVYWVPYDDADAGRALKAFSNTDYRFVLENCDADEFFYELLLEIGKTPPLVLSDLSAFAAKAKEQTKTPDWYPNTRSQREAARTGFGPGPEVGGTADQLNSLVSRPEHLAGWTGVVETKPTSAGG